MYVQSRAHGKPISADCTVTVNFQPTAIPTQPAQYSTDATASVESRYAAATGRACALPGSPLDKVSAGLDLCVHCGFCLPACPTYLALEDENDSPRGRILLMRQLLEGGIAVTDSDATSHFDKCLGCRACETACPSGVPYGELIEATRASMLESHGMPWTARVILGVFSRRWLLRTAMTGARLLRATRIPVLLARLLPRRLAFPFAMLASTSPVKPGQYAVPLNAGDLGTTDIGIADRGITDRGTTDLETADPGTTDRGTPHPQIKVAMLDGCVMHGLYAHVNRATERCLTRAGCTLTDAPGQVCCGALHAHAGDLKTAQALARTNIAAFEASSAEFIVVNSAGCGAMMKGYAHLLSDTASGSEGHTASNHDAASADNWHNRAQQFAARVRDISEFLATRAQPPAVAALNVSATHDAPCHQQHAQRVVRQPLDLLAGIPGLRFTPLTDSDQCCGSAGIYSLIEPDVSESVLAPKLTHIAETRATLVATGNPGCMMQIGAGLMLSGSSTRTVHPVELLDAAAGARSTVTPGGTAQ